jgi:hypothetical protein
VYKLRNEILHVNSKALITYHYIIYVDDMQYSEIFEKVRERSGGSQLSFSALADLSCMHQLNFIMLRVQNDIVSICV